MTQPCECPGPGFCHRHQLPKDEHLWNLCRTDERYRAAFETYAQIAATSSPKEVPPVYCRRWEEIGDSTYRCQRCGVVAAAHSPASLPKERACELPKRATAIVAKQECGGCGGDSPTVEKKRLEIAPRPTEMPPVAERLSNFWGAIKDFVQEPGFVSERELHARIEICTPPNCDRAQGHFCSVCGCHLPNAAALKSKHCPMGKWPGDETGWKPLVHTNWLKKTLVVIPHYGDAKLTRECVRDCHREGVRVLVVDNQGNYPTVAGEEVARMSTNVGWGEACNVGIERLLADKDLQGLVLLNNDVRLSENFFSGLIVAQVVTGAAIVSATYNVGWVPQRPADRYSGTADKYQPKPTHRLATHCDGTGVLIVRELVEALGKFDVSVSPKYGWGLLIDYALRAKEVGQSVAITEASYMYHRGMQAAEKVFGSVETYIAGARAESDTGLARKWGGDWRQKIGSPKRVAREIGTLNLIYHIWPVASNNRWRWNVEQLLKRIGIFNGKKIVAIAEGGGTDPVGEVKAMFAGHDVEFIVKPNSKELREANTFLELLDRVRTGDQTEATFYGHAKGVTRPTMLAEAMWADAMYHACLDNPERVKSALTEKGMYGLSFEFEQPYIFPGTFWWFHNASLFAKPNWRTLENRFTDEGIGWAVEAFPNRFFADDCERVYLPMVYPRGKSRHLIYSAEFWLAQTPTLEQALSRFDEAHYLASYYDIRREVESGAMDSGRGHYIRHGYEEGREGYSVLKYFGVGDLS